MQGKHLSELCHPIILLIHLSSFFPPQLSADVFFLLYHIRIVVIKLVGFCGFEVEQGEKHGSWCFVTGTLHRRSKNEQTAKEGCTGEEVTD